MQEVLIICQKLLDPYKDDSERYPQICALSFEFRNKIRAIINSRSVESENLSLGYGSFNVQNSDSDDEILVQI